MNPLYAELQWLPRAPANFSARLKEVSDLPGSTGQAIQALALHALDVNQLIKLARVIEKVRAESVSGGKSLHPLAPFRLAILSNSTIDLIVPALVASAARHGIALEVIQPSYDQVAQEALTPDSKVNSAKPDRLPAGTRRWHKDSFSRCVYLSNICSTGRNSFRQSGSSVAGDTQEPDRRGQPGVICASSWLGRCVARCGWVG